MTKSQPGSDKTPSAAPGYFPQRAPSVPSGHQLPVSPPRERSDRWGEYGEAGRGVCVLEENPKKLCSRGRKQGRETSLELAVSGEAQIDTTMDRVGPPRDHHFLPCVEVDTFGAVDGVAPKDRVLPATK